MTKETKPTEITNLNMWNKLGETDPKFTKAFDKGTFKGTAISPMYCYKKMTEVYGACGTGWKIELSDKFQVDSPTGDKMIYVLVNLYTKNNGVWSDPICGAGGEWIVRNTKSGLKVDDEAFKKALTDATTNAMKMLGMSADIHMGMFDDNKYINTLKEKYKTEGTIENAVSMAYTEEQLEQSKEQLIPSAKVIKNIEKAKDIKELKTIWINAYNARKEYGEVVIGNIQNAYNNKKISFLPSKEEQTKIYDKALNMISSIATLDRLTKYRDENEEEWQNSLSSEAYADIKTAIVQAMSDITRENNQRNGDLV